MTRAPHLFDAARPLYDAALAEIEGHPGVVDPHALAAAKLGMALNALVGAFAFAHRNDPHIGTALFFAVGQGFGIAVANAASNLGPPSWQVGTRTELMLRIAGERARACADSIQAGDVDVDVAVAVHGDMGEDSVLRPGGADFDFRDLLRSKP